jgi:hypothetical protein
LTKSHGNTSDFHLFVAVFLTGMHHFLAMKSNGQTSPCETTAIVENALLRMQTQSRAHTMKNHNMCTLLLFFVRAGGLVLRYESLFNGWYVA